MWEWVGNILWLVESLCIWEDKIFIIEEPENDIHPKALKELLNLIKEKANQNQFFISTHSNIVMKQLWAMSDTKIFHVTNNQEAVSRGEIFTSSLVEVSDDPIDRRNILEDLWYEFSDLELWKWWLFLEESSAEILIRDYFIEWFAPKLVGKLRTFSASWVDKIKMKFDDFNSLFVFLHLEPTYKNKVWVLIDGGTKEQEILQKMKAAYISSWWNESNFSQLTEHDFEKYYPVEFQQAVTEILAIGDTKIKRARKKALLEEVKTWIIADEQRAKKEFSITAKEVIERLQEISDALR